MFKCLKLVCSPPNKAIAFVHHFFQIINNHSDILIRLDNILDIYATHISVIQVYLVQILFFYWYFTSSSFTKVFFIQKVLSIISENRTIIVHVRNKKEPIMFIPSCINCSTLVRNKYSQQHTRKNSSQWVHLLVLVQNS